MTADPHADEKERQAALTAAALVLVYVDIREDVLNRITLGRLQNLLRPEWVDRVRLTATQHAKRTAAAIARSVDPSFDVSRMDAYLEKTVDTWARTWGENTQERLALDADLQRNAAEILAGVVDDADDDADLITRRSANLAAKDAAEANGLTSKTWHTSGGDSRASHAAQDGLSIPIEAAFPNGLAYPAAPGPPAEVINCRCYLTFGA